jgi:hypothetical protein
MSGSSHVCLEVKTCVVFSQYIGHELRAVVLGGASLLRNRFFFHRQNYATPILTTAQTACTKCRNHQEVLHK